jgi:hypothetical protein
MLKIVWGMFAFPRMYPAPFAAALSLPLLALLGCAMLASAVADQDGMRWAQYVVYLLAGSWLAIRCHRLVLLGSGRAPSEPMQAARALGLFALTYSVIWLIKVAITFLFVAVVLAVTASRYVAASDVPVTPPEPDPAVQQMIDLVALGAQIPGMYVFARLSPLFPMIATGESWNARTAVRLTRGNGWRLAIAVFLLPEIGKLIIELVYSQTPGIAQFVLGALLLAVVTALGVVGLSLAYCELTRAPPPTHPHA